ncbi:lanthionine synthetase C family protein [Streptomyces albipurpureus]|uniref:Lanthionine synthetase C family protein n=1 Tax=Streptomyces albipurpureus TaxID=2897419 RepID=A0ABT0UZ96_9ACTN|nr:lanthionine synthetase C family protein [Streptomyces sp. CWNU-1]MCM2393898.1 lanthionine synthetase C family protein [Streptomyces sp. CWNU-1]
MTTASTEGAAAVRAQSLARGAAGAALLAVEHARRGSGSWQEVHAALAACTTDLVADESAGLYTGAPAVAFALHTAAGDSDRYARALHQLDARIIHLTTRRLEQAHARIDCGQRPLPREFDLFYGLTGLGAYLLGRNPNAPVLREVLDYLVRLTRPLDRDTDRLPGWWTPAAPAAGTGPEFGDGHANLGMAHGIAGVLALLSLTALRGTAVDGQLQAIRYICAWLDQWRQTGSSGPWWPQWITLTEHRTGSVARPGPRRPSWCYGTPGLVRAQQLAARALGDTARQNAAEGALLSCLADPAQLARVQDAGICHGAAGLLHTAHQVARDALTDAFAAHLPRLRTLLHDQVHPQETGFLEGSTGPALAVLADRSCGRTASGWDLCLLTGPQ